MATCPHCGRPYLFCVCRGLHRAGSARPSFHEVWGPKPMPHQAHTFSIFRAVLVAFRRDMRARASTLFGT